MDNFLQETPRAGESPGAADGREPPIMRALFVLNALDRGFGAPMGALTTLRNLQIVLQVAGGQRTTQADLARRFGITNAAASLAVLALENRCGVIERRAVANARLLTLSGSGAQCLASAAQATHDEGDQFVAVAIAVLGAFEAACGGRAPHGALRTLALMRVAALLGACGGLTERDLAEALGAKRIQVRNALAYLSSDAPWGETGALAGADTDLRTRTGRGWGLTGAGQAFVARWVAGFEPAMRSAPAAH